MFCASRVGFRVREEHSCSTYKTLPLLSHLCTRHNAKCKLSYRGLGLNGVNFESKIANRISTHSVCFLVI